MYYVMRSERFMNLAQKREVEYHKLIFYTSIYRGSELQSAIHFVREYNKRTYQSNRKVKT